MSMTMLGLVADTVIKLARRQCHEKHCGISSPKPGKDNQPGRCLDCPLDDVDRLADEMAKEAG